MGLLSKLFKGIKKVVRKIGGGIKRLVKKVGGVFGEMGILGHIGMMFLMPYAQSFWGSLGKIGTQLASGTSIAGKAFGHVMRGVYHAGRAVGTVYRTVTSAVEGSLKWLSNKVGLTDIANPFSGLDKVVQDAQNWGRAGWTGNKVHEISTYALPDKKMLADGTTPVATEKALGLETSVNDNLSVKFSDDFRKSIGEKADVSNVTDITADTITNDFKQRNLLEKGQEYLGKVWDETKQQFTPSGIADTVTEGMTAGLKQKGAELIVGKPPDPLYKSVKLDFGGIGLTNTPVLDDLAMSNYDTKGFSFGAHQMNNNFGELRDMGYDDYLSFMENTMPILPFKDYKFNNQSGF
jgi:hypothetical protein